MAIWRLRGQTAKLRSTNIARDDMLQTIFIIMQGAAGV
jgi:hypothetical protein